MQLLPTVILFLISSSRIGLQQLFHLNNQNMSNTNTSCINNSSSSQQHLSSPTTTSTSDALMFLSQICGKLKRIKRTGWIRHKVPLPESDSDHMHRCAMCALLLTTQLPPDSKDEYAYTLPEYQKFHPSHVNSAKLLKMAMTHDLCESIAGDITPFCDVNVVNSKYDNENEAMMEIRNVVGDPLGLELYELWKEYEEQETIEALYCKDIDKFEMVMQAYEYELEYLGFQKDCNENENENKIDDDANDDRGTGDDEINKDTITPLRTFFITTNNKMKSPFFRRLDAELRQKREALLKERGWKVTQEERQNY